MPAIKKLFAAAAILTAAAIAYAAEQPLELYFFGSATCGECLEIKNSLLNPLERELGGKLKIHHHDTDNEESFKLMISLEKQYDIKNGSPQELFFPDTFLLGFDHIMANAERMIRENLSDPMRKKSIIVGETVENLDDALRERFDTFTFVAILSAALIDSVNPCAIATMIFLISFLATQKRRRGEVFITGLTFTFAVFITYFLLGLGAFRIITVLKTYYWVSQVIKWLAVAFAGIIGIISLVDGLRFKKTGDAKQIKLQLPKSVKMRIHKIITTQMTGSRLYLGAFIAGFLVTLLEAICTGQVYLPTIILMTRSGSGELKLMGWLYLTMYNFIFVLPLLAVMVAAYYGMKWNTLSKMMQKNLTMLKILLGIVMIGLAIYLATDGKWSTLLELVQKK
jgi:cytochrome c biogenesis protein CcdA